MNSAGKINFEAASTNDALIQQQKNRGYAPRMMKQVLTDEAVIEQFLTTRPTYCFETLYTRYQAKVLRRCLTMTRDAELAQDYTQDIFIRMFTRLDRFEGRSSFSTWLYTIASNYVLDQLRLSKRIPTATLDEGHNYDTFTTDNEAETLESNLQELGRAMQGISGQDARILRLKYQEGLDVRQIGYHLNIGDSAVKMRLKRSRDRVRHLYTAAA
jgi:RNA polymerase sigma factor (sigma-70 family)